MTENNSKSRENVSAQIGSKLPDLKIHIFKIYDCKWPEFNNDFTAFTHNKKSCPVHLRIFLEDKPTCWVHICFQG